MMKYLVDVNCSKSNKFLKEHPNFENVKYSVGQEAKDQEIMKYAKKADYVLFTQDKEFALFALIEGFKVWYRDQQSGKEFKLIANLVDFN